MKKFTVPCDFGGTKYPFDIYIGEPTVGMSPLFFQSLWLRSERGGTVPAEVLDSFSRLFTIALDNNVSFEDLCVYALGEATQKKQEQESAATEPPPADSGPS